MMPMMRAPVLLCLTLLMTGCGTSSAWQRDSTARSVGCKPDEVRVTRQDSGSFDNIQAWYADCRGMHYRCVFVPGDRGGCYPAARAAS